MSKVFEPDLTPEQRYQMLKDQAEKVEDTTFKRTLTQEELDVKREELAQNLIDIDTKEDELDRIKEEYKGAIKPMKAQCKILLECVKTRKEEVKGQLFHLQNHHEGMMEVYDESGELISSRRLRPDEKQLRAFPLRKAGEN